MPALLWIIVKFKFLITLIVPPSPPCPEGPARFDFGTRLDPGYSREIVIVHEVFKDPHMQGLSVFYLNREKYQVFQVSKKLDQQHLYETEKLSQEVPWI
jgi:hypothetical protein